MTYQIAQWLISLYQSIKVGSADLIYTISRDDISKWNDILTNIIGVSAAVGALALPIAINVIESTLIRYKSSTLVKLQNQISNTNLPRTNFWIFFSLAFAVILKITIASNKVPTEITATITLVFSLLFLGLISDIYRFLNYTFTLISDLDKIRKRIEALLENEIHKSRKHKKNQQPLNTDENLETVITSLFEIEAYEVAMSFDKQDLSENLRGLLSDHTKTLENKISKRILNSAFSSFPKLLKEVEEMRSVELYSRYAGFYAYIAARVMCQDKDFTWIFLDLEKIARNREIIPPKSGRVCKSGQVLLNIAHLKPAREVQQAISRHFNSLMWVALEKDIEVLPNLIEHCNSIFFYTRNGPDTWEYARIAPELWRYEGIREISNAAKKSLSGEMKFEDFRDLILNTHAPRMKELMLKNTALSDKEKEEKSKKLDETTEELIDAISFNELATEIKTTVLTSLISIYNKSPETLISCRALKNPAGSNINNIGYNVVPSSIQACIKELVQEKNFQTYSRITSDTVELDIINGLSVLLIYELWGEYIVKPDGLAYRARTVTDVAQGFDASSFKLREIKSAIPRLDTLNRCIIQNLEHGGIREALKITAKQKKIIEKNSRKLTSTLKDKFNREIEIKVKTGKLDENTINRFYEESYDSFREEIQNLKLFKSLKIGKTEGHTFNLQYPRVAFVEHDDTHHVFDNIARECIRNYHGWMCERIISSRPISAEDSWPTTNTKLLLLTYKTLDHLEKNGFKFDNKATWPDNIHECDFHVAHGDELLYSPVIMNESLVKAEFACETKMPFLIKHQPDENYLNFKLVFKFELTSAVAPVQEAVTTGS